MVEPQARTVRAAIEPRHDDVKELHAYWIAKKREPRAPVRADIDPLEIARLPPPVTLVDVKIVRNVGDDFTGCYFDSFLRLSHGEAMAAEFTRVVESATPAISDWEYMRGDGRHVRYERLILPLMADGATVDMLFGGMAFDVADG